MTAHKGKRAGRHLTGYLLAVLLGCFTPSLLAEQVLRSSVSPEFVDGLHAKYLRYIAQQLKLPLDIYPMPFARRIDALKEGQIDLMVGLKRAYPEQGFVYIEPGYETLRNAYFVRANEKHRIQSRSDLAGLAIGVTIDNPASLMEVGSAYRQVVSVTSLEQKIQLLHMGRIDIFAHFQSSSEMKIDELGLTGDIVPADFQPGAVRQYFVALSTVSPLYQQRDAITAIIARAVENGDFARIRLKHESVLMASQ
ncbi:substrate-binding periplasmic protein [Alteromonas sp. CYL-A6]|uniref:substrate-binding periplasmic protein n=1 Tax=Alteromonas nitratireducens TaxID=3390813 RepID=UPI0034B54E10